MINLLLLYFAVLFLALPTTTVVIVKASTVHELTAENWDETTRGKSIWVKFCTTSCHHCKQMHIAWERLGDEFVNESNVVIGRVNCDKEESLCQRFHIIGTPTLLYGNPYDLQEYGGDKDFISLNAWAKEVLLVPICSPDHVQGCSETERRQLEEWMTSKYTVKDIEDMIQSVWDREEQIKVDFQSQMEELQGQYDVLENQYALVYARIHAHKKLLQDIRNYKQASNPL